MPDPNMLPQIVQPQPPNTGNVGAVTIAMQPRHVNVHPVFDYELASLRSASYPVGLTFFGICAGAAGGFASVVFTQNPTDKNHEMFVALFWGSLVLSVFFAIWSARSWWVNHELVKEIKRRPSGP